ncbi:MAG: 4Fe-4S binding protein [Rhodocyclaceae bacterium]
MTASVPEVRGSACIRYRYRYSECRRCADACPHEAVVLSDEGVTLDPSRCRNCALCASACRSGAIDAKSAARIELLRAAVKQPAWSFACAPSQVEADAVVPCLGALDAVMLAYLAKRGIAVELRGAHHCEQCAHGVEGAAQLALNLEGMKLLEAAAEGESWCEPVLAASPDEDRRGPAPVSGARRQLFRRLFGRAADAIAQAGASADPQPVPKKAIRAGAYFLPDQRRLLDIVAKRAGGAAASVPAHASIPALDLELDDGCTACEACFRVCPTGAIQIEESSSAWALTFDAARCVGCEVCIEVCQPRVLHAAKTVRIVPAETTRLLHGLSKQRCAVCDRFFVSPEPRDKCDICRDDEEAFGAIFG